MTYKQKYYFDSANFFYYYLLNCLLHKQLSPIRVYLVTKETTKVCQNENCQVKYHL